MDKPTPTEWAHRAVDALLRRCCRGIAEEFLLMAWARGRRR